MSDLFVVLYTDPILHKPVKQVEVIDDALMELAGQMLVTMRRYHGVGLSANQVGIDKNFCVVSLENNTKQLALINPKIIDTSKKKVLLYEGCLSAPRVFPPMKRHQSVIVEFQDFSGGKNVYEFTDLDARIIQHELDHLSGKTVVDPYIKLPKEFLK